MSEQYHKRMMEIVRDLKSQGVHRFASAPLEYRILWKLGIKVKPPYYQSLLVLSLTTWIKFVLLIIFAKSILRIESDAIDILVIVVIGLFAGVSYALLKKKHAKDVILPPIETKNTQVKKRGRV